MIGDFLGDLAGLPNPLDAPNPLDPTALDTTALDTAVLPPLTELAPDPVEAPEALRTGVYDPSTVLWCVGDPTADAAHWQFQGPEMACAVVSQGAIIESLTGLPFDKDAATTWLAAQEWYDPATGTRPENLTRLFDHFEVPYSTGPATVEQLADGLAAGDKVMVTLDANEIWHPEVDPATGEPKELTQPAGHVVWVTGIQMDTSGAWQVVLNDSGHEGGRAETVALADFVNAWDDYRYQAFVAGGRSAPLAPNPTGGSA